jgi:hypothetical protein
MLQSRDTYLRAVASGWIPHTLIGTLGGPQVVGPYSKLLPAPFNQRESNPLKTTVLAKPSDHLLLGKRGRDASEVSVFPLSIECVSCGLNRVREDHHTTENDSITDSTQREDTTHSVLVMPR